VERFIGSKKESEHGRKTFNQCGFSINSDSFQNTAFGQIKIGI
jgi:hypothetical protein